MHRVTDGMNVQRWPGERLGRPESGPGSVAGWGRRIAALALDWAASLMVVSLFVGPEVWTAGGGVEWAPLAVFLGERWLLTSMLGGSAGQLVTRTRVLGVDGRPLGPGRVLLRTLLICLVIPPVVYNRDRRGLHDLAAGSVAVNV